MAGHFAYYAVPSNSRAISALRHYVTDLWWRTLQRRSEKGGFGFRWQRMTKLVADWLPPAHPSSLADERFRRNYNVKMPRVDGLFRTILEWVTTAPVAIRGLRRFGRNRGSADLE